MIPNWKRVPPTRNVGLRSPSGPVLPGLCFQASVKRGEDSRREGGAGSSDLRLQVDDLLAHQRDCGAALLPFNCLELQRRCRQRLQLWADPGGGRVGLRDALPGSVAGGLWLVLLGGGETGEALVETFNQFLSKCIKRAKLLI